jgi:hypothetical protein
MNYVCVYIYLYTDLSSYYDGLKHYIASNSLQVKIAWHFSVTNGIGGDRGKKECRIHIVVHGWIYWLVLLHSFKMRINLLQGRIIISVTGLETYLHISFTRFQDYA